MTGTAAIDGIVAAAGAGGDAKCGEELVRLGDSLDEEVQRDEAELLVVFDLLLVAGVDDGGGAQELSRQWRLGFRGEDERGHGERKNEDEAREEGLSERLILSRSRLGGSIAPWRARGRATASLQARRLGTTKIANNPLETFKLSRIGPWPLIL